MCHGGELFLFVIIVLFKYTSSMWSAIQGSLAYGGNGGSGARVTLEVGSA